MSLIPSESLNFPDSFRANVGWRLPKESQADPMPPRGDSPVPADIHIHPGAANGHSEEVGQLPTNTVNGYPLPTEPVQPERATGIEWSKSEHTPPANPPAETAAKHEALDSLGVPGGQDTPESIPQAAVNQEPAAPTLVVSGESAHALIAQLFRLQPVTELPAEIANPQTAAPPEVEAEPEPTAVEIQVPAQSGAKPVTPTSAAAPTPEIKTQRKVEFSFMDSSGAAAAEVPAEPMPIATAAPAEPVVEPVSAPEPMVVQTPAQAQHLFELIAAAVERGALVGGPVTDPPASIPPQPAAIPPSEQFASAPPPTIQSVPEPATPPQAEQPIPPTLPAVRPAESPRKTPAKIRITPRKIKPRPIPPTEPANSAPVLPAETEVVPGTHFTPAPPPVSQPVPLSRPAVTPPVLPEPEKAAPVADRWEPKHPPRKIHGGGLSQTSFFSARERRNRWIGFGLGEAAALTALILLARFAMTHKFPDPTLKVLVFILAFAAAAIAIALPIPFVRNDPARWQR